MAVVTAPDGDGISFIHIIQGIYHSGVVPTPLLVHDDLALGLGDQHVDWLLDEVTVFGGNAALDVMGEYVVFPLRVVLVLLANLCAVGVFDLCEFLADNLKNAFVCQHVFSPVPIQHSVYRDGPGVQELF